MPPTPSPPERKQAHSHLSFQRLLQSTYVNIQVLVSDPSLLGEETQAPEDRYANGPPDKRESDCSKRKPCFGLRDLLLFSTNRDHYGQSSIAAPASSTLASES